jgi:hypothetical protein
MVDALLGTRSVQNGMGDMRDRFWALDAGVAAALYVACGDPMDLRAEPRATDACASATNAHPAAP